MRKWNQERYYRLKAYNITACIQCPSAIGQLAVDYHSVHCHTKEEESPRKREQEEEKISEKGEIKGEKGNYEEKDKR